MDEIIDVTPTQSEPLRIAGNGARFGNYLADTIVFYLLIFGLTIIFDSGTMSQETADLLGIIPFFFYFLFLTLFEFACGKTPGKFLTRTKVVKQDGTRPNFLNLLGRNAARLIPFDALSFLFADRGWHDSLSGTYVVYEEGRS